VFDISEFELESADYICKRWWL